MGTVEHVAVMNNILLPLHSSSKSTTSLKLQGIKKQIEVSANSHSFHLRVPKQYYSKRPYGLRKVEKIRANIMWNPRLDLTHTHQTKNYYK